MVLGTSGGISLMASLHPRYPLLEMAHFGLRTVTNSYVCKDLTGFHPGIISIDSVADGPLTAALAEACASAATRPVAFANADPLRTDAYPFLGALVQSIKATLVAHEASGHSVGSLTPPQGRTRN